MRESICGFVKTVAEQIRWKKARGGLTEELTTHLLEQKEACLAEGMTNEEAEREAIRQMGDPVAIGAELDRIHRPRPQWGLLIFAGILLIVGALLRLVLTKDMEYFSSPVSDIGSAVLGLAALMVGYLLDISFAGKRVKILFPLFLVLQAVLYLFGPTVNYVKWPIRQVMLLFPALLAALMWSLRRRGWLGALISLTAAGLGLCVACMIPCTFTVFQVILSALMLGLFFNTRDWFGVGKRIGVAVTVLLAAVMLSGVIWHCWARWRYAVFPELAPAGQGYFATVIRMVLPYARWLGPADFTVSIGGPIDMLVPEMEGDALLVNMICRFGWLPFLVLMSAFAGFFLWAIWKTVHLRQALGKVVAAAVLVTLLTQCAAGLLLTFGVPLMEGSFPLVVGNWASVLNMFLIGIMLSAFRDGALPEAQHVPGKLPRYKLTVKLERV